MSHHSCLEAKTQFFELFNNTFNIFPVLLAPTTDIYKVSNPEQKEIGLFGLQIYYKYIESVVEQFKKLGFNFRTAVRH